MTPLETAMRRWTTLSGAALLAASALSAGCAWNPMGTHAPVLTATLAGTEEVPPNQSPGTGSLEARFNTDTRVLTWKVTHAGLTGPVTGAHFHGPAAPGVNAGVVLPFKPPYTSPIQGEATLSAIQAADLLAGRWYVNLHTAAHPGGELRGQVLARP